MDDSLKAAAVMGEFFGQKIHPLKGYASSVPPVGTVLPTPQGNLPTVSSAPNMFDMGSSFSASAAGFAGVGAGGGNSSDTNGMGVSPRQLPLDVGMGMGIGMGMESTEQRSIAGASASAIEASSSTSSMDLTGIPVTRSSGAMGSGVAFDAFSGIGSGGGGGGKFSGFGGVDPETGLMCVSSPQSLSQSVDNLVVWSRLVMKSMDQLQWKQVCLCECVCVQYSKVDYLFPSVI